MVLNGWCRRAKKKTIALELSTTVFIHFSHNFPISNINDGAYTVHAKSWQLLDIHSLSLGYMFVCFLLKHTWSSSVLGYLPHHGPPHIEKKIHPVCTEGRAGVTAGLCVSPEKTCCCMCAFLVLSLSTFQPIILQGERALSVIVL